MGTDICILFDYYDPQRMEWRPVAIKENGIIILSNQDFNEIISVPELWNWDETGLQHDTGRDYSLFGLLAGVRYNMVPLVPRRGFPVNSEYYKNKVSREYLLINHSFTYYLLSELTEADTLYNRENFGYESMAVVIQPLVSFCNENNLQKENFRAILSFN